jgi:hypothetical protein
MLSHIMLHVLPWLLLGLAVAWWPPSSTTEDARPGQAVVAAAACPPGTRRNDETCDEEDTCYRRSDACNVRANDFGLDMSWFELALADHWRRQLLLELASLEFDCSRLQAWNTSCRHPADPTPPYWQVYHASVHTSHLHPRTHHSFAIATSPNVTRRDDCDLAIGKLWPASLSGPISLMAEYGAILPLSMMSDCLFAPITTHLATGFGSWKTDKLPRPCHDMAHLDWSAVYRDGRFFVVWNTLLGDDLAQQAALFHPGLWDVLQDFFLRVFRFHLNHIPGPHACCSHFYADPLSLQSLARLQMLAFLFMESHYPRLNGRCPFDPFPVDQHHRCWAFVMERITAIYMYVSGARWFVDASRCRLERQPSSDRRVVRLPDRLIRLVWDAAVTEARKRRNEEGPTRTETSRDARPQTGD